jgi:hypothetical protein
MSAQAETEFYPPNLCQPQQETSLIRIIVAILFPNPRHVVQESAQSLPVRIEAAARLRCGLCRILGRGQTNPPKLSALRRWGLYGSALVFGVAEEMHSLLHRMALRRERRYESHGLVLGPDWQATPAGRFQVCTRTHACISDIGNFERHNPWATLVDVETYRDAWLAGAEWASRNSCTAEPEQCSTQPPSNER